MKNNSYEVKSKTAMYCVAEIKTSLFQHSNSSVSNVYTNTPEVVQLAARPTVATVRDV